VDQADLTTITKPAQHGKYLANLCRILYNKGRQNITEKGSVHLARTITDFQTARPDEQVRQIVMDYMKNEGFSYTTVKGEPVWKKGVGALTAPQFMKVECQNGHVHMEAWIKYALLPGVYVGEMALKGFFGIAVKKPLKKRMELLTQILTQQA
jgi:hypothetical protein